MAYWTFGGIRQFSMLPPSLFYFAGGYVETSYGGQAMLDARKMVNGYQVIRKSGRSAVRRPVELSGQQDIR